MTLGPLTPDATYHSYTVVENIGSCECCGPGVGTDCQYGLRSDDTLWINIVITDRQNNDEVCYDEWIKLSPHPTINCRWSSEVIGNLFDNCIETDEEGNPPPYMKISWQSDGGAGSGHIGYPSYWDEEGQNLAQTRFINCTSQKEIQDKDEENEFSITFDGPCKTGQKVSVCGGDCAGPLRFDVEFREITTQAPGG